MDVSSLDTNSIQWHYQTLQVLLIVFKSMCSDIIRSLHSRRFLFIVRVCTDPAFAESQGFGGRI